MIKERTQIKHIRLQQEACKRNIMKLTVYFSLKNLPNESKNESLHQSRTILGNFLESSKVVKCDGAQLAGV